MIYPIRNRLAAALNQTGRCEHPGSDSCDTWWRADAARAVFAEWLRGDEARRVVTNSLRAFFMTLNDDTESNSAWRPLADRILTALAAEISEGTQIRVQHEREDDR